MECGARGQRCRVSFSRTPSPRSKHALPVPEVSSFGERAMCPLILLSPPASVLLIPPPSPPHDGPAHPHLTNFTPHAHACVPGDKLGQHKSIQIDIVATNPVRTSFPHPRRRYNAGASPATFRTLAYAKSSAARAPTGPVPNEKTEAEKYISARLVAAQARLGPGPAAEAAAVGAGAGFKWPARWQCFEASCDVGSGQRRLLMVVAASGVQAELAEVKCSLVGRGEGQSAGQALGGEAGQSPAKRKGGAEGGHAAVNEAASAAAMKRWLGGTGGTHSASGSPAGASSLDPGSSASVADDIFAEVPLDYCPPQPAGWASTSEALEQLRRQARDGRRRPGGTGPSNGPGGVDPNAGFSGFVEPSHPEQAFDYDLQAALSASLASLDEAHRASGPRDHAPVEPGIPAGAGGDAGTEADDAWQLEVAIALSLGMPPPPKPAAPAAQTAQYRGGHSTVSTGGSVGRKEPVVIDLLDSDGD